MGTKSAKPTRLDRQLARHVVAGAVARHLEDVIPQIGELTMLSGAFLTAVEDEAEKVRARMARRAELPWWTMVSKGDAIMTEEGEVTVEQTWDGYGLGVSFCDDGKQYFTVLNTGELRACSPVKEAKS